jgi:hypothetical protein
MIVRQAFDAVWIVEVAIPFYTHQTGIVLMQTFETVAARRNCMSTPIGPQKAASIFLLLRRETAVNYWN